MKPAAVSSDKPITEIRLANGLIVRFCDMTRRYYGDFHLVKLEMTCQVPLLREYFESAEAYVEARALLGETVVFARTIERMGVPAAEVGMAFDLLMTNFEKHACAYLASPSFPRKLILSRLNKAGRTPGFIPSGTPVHA